VSYAQRSFINALSEKNVGMYGLADYMVSETNTCDFPVLAVLSTSSFRAGEFYQALWHFVLIIICAIFLSTLKPYVGTFATGIDVSEGSSRHSGGLITS
jgi:hypothetical protein